MTFTPAVNPHGTLADICEPGLWPHLGKDVAAVPMHIVEFLIIGEDVRPALHRACPGARQVLALPQSPEAGAVGESMSRRDTVGRGKPHPTYLHKGWLAYQELQLVLKDSPGA